MQTRTVFIVVPIMLVFVFSSFASLPSSAAVGKSSPFLNQTFGISPLCLVYCRPVKEKCPDCWSGYGLESDSFGAVTGVSAFLIVPAVSCTKKSAASTFLVALDGSSSDDFALSAVIVNCSGGNATWLAEWYNAADGSSGVASWTPKSGDNVSLSVSEAAGTVHFKIVDLTQKKKLGGSGSASGMALLEATCFSDMLTNKNTGKVYPQVNFGTVTFTNCMGTVEGKTKAIWGFNTSIEKLEWITYNGQVTQPLNKVGKLLDKENFVVTFERAGP